MQKDKIKRVLRYVALFVTFMFVFSFALACGWSEEGRRMEGIKA